MNDDFLKKRLTELKVPEPDEAARDKALHRALIALKNAPDASPQPSAQPVRRLLWAWAATGALAAIVLTMWLSREPKREDSFAWQRTLQEVEALFPGQVNAVIERDGQVDVELAEANAGGTGQPVVVEFVQGSRVLRVLSYSGRQVCVELNGEKACFEPLVTAEGGVILSGKDFLWTSEHPVSREGYRVEARFLHPTS
jgi:hypothetical protein